MKIKKSSNVLIWILAIVFIAIVGLGLWYFISTNQVGTPTLVTQPSNFVVELTPSQESGDDIQSQEAIEQSSILTCPENHKIGNGEPIEKIFSDKINIIAINKISETQCEVLVKWQVPCEHVKYCEIYLAFDPPIYQGKNRIDNVRADQLINVSNAGGGNLRLFIPFDGKAHSVEPILKCSYGMQYYEQNYTGEKFSINF